MMRTVVPAVDLGASGGKLRAEHTVDLIDELRRVQPSCDATLICNDDDSKACTLEKTNRVNAPWVDNQLRVGRDIAKFIENRPVAIEKRRRLHKPPSSASS